MLKRRNAAGVTARALNNVQTYFSHRFQWSALCEIGIKWVLRWLLNVNTVLQSNDSWKTVGALVNGKTTL